MWSYIHTSYALVLIRHRAHPPSFLNVSLICFWTTSTPYPCIHSKILQKEWDVYKHFKTTLIKEGSPSIYSACLLPSPAVIRNVYISSAFHFFQNLYFFSSNTPTETLKPLSNTNTLLKIIHSQYHILEHGCYPDTFWGEAPENTLTSFSLSHLSTPMNTSVSIFLSPFQFYIPSENPGSDKGGWCDLSLLTVPMH
jgi:hypothetical protein